MGSVSICRVFKCELPAQVFRCDSFPQRLINNKALMYSRAKSMHGMIAVLCNLPGIFITNAEMYFIHSYTRTGIFFSHSKWWNQCYSERHQRAGVCQGDKWRRLPNLTVLATLNIPCLTTNHDCLLGVVTGFNLDIA